MTTETKAPTAHSHSRLQAFTQCPLSYKLMYMDKVPQDSSDALEIGSAAHEFFERFVQFHNGSAALTPVGIEKLAAECFQKEARDQSNFKDYLEICRTFAKEYKPDPAYPDVESERQVAFDKNWKTCTWYSPDVRFRAKIDLLELPGTIAKKIRITDFKTGYAGQMDSFQLDVYAFIASLIFPHLEQVEICFYYVKSGFKQVKLLNVDDMGITKIQLEALMARVEGEKKWKAKPGSRCLNCPVAASCTEKPSNLIKIDSEAIAQQLGAEIAFLDAQSKAKKKGLNAWCKENGKVETGGLVYGHYPSESMVIEMAPLLSACVSYQIDPAKILNPDSRAIKKAFKENPGFAEMIAPYVGIDVSMRFYAKKADGDDE